MSKKPSPNFDDTRQYKDDRDSKKEVKEYCSTCGEVHGNECPEYFKVIKLDAILHGVEPKPECNHIVGYRNESDEVPDGDDYHYYDHNIIVYLSELDTKADIENYLERKFKCCPLCEKRLNWEEIEKKLNLKKDE
jgi:hypothetical protein